MRFKTFIDTIIDDNKVGFSATINGFDINILKLQNNKHNKAVISLIIHFL